jgi:hypothetical protein
MKNLKNTNAEIKESKSEQVKRIMEVLSNLTLKTFENEQAKLVKEGIRYGDSLSAWSSQIEHGEGKEKVFVKLTIFIEEQEKLEIHYMFFLQNSEGDYHLGNKHQGRYIKLYREFWETCISYTDKMILEGIEKDKLLLFLHLNNRIVINKDILNEIEL